MITLLALLFALLPLLAFSVFLLVTPLRKHSASKRALATFDPISHDCVAPGTVRLHSPRAPNSLRDYARDARVVEIARSLNLDYFTAGAIYDASESKVWL